MCGIFAWLAHETPDTKEHLISVLVNGLRRLEYRGYDSAGTPDTTRFKTGILTLSRRAVVRVQ